MIYVYPVKFTLIEDDWYMAEVLDFQLSTQGKNLSEAIFMARDAIGLMGITLYEQKKAYPKGSEPKTIKLDDNEILSMVDIDFDAYRKANDTRTVRRNISLPCWLNEAVEKSGLNVSAICQNAIKQELKLS